MKVINTALALAFAGLAATSSLEDRQLHRACFHKGSVALCCPEKGDVAIATGCSTPPDVSSALAFRAGCKAEKLTAQCCETAYDDTGFICAPVPKDPPK